MADHNHGVAQQKPAGQDLADPNPYINNVGGGLFLVCHEYVIYDNISFISYEYIVVCCDLNFKIVFYREGSLEY